MTAYKNQIKLKHVLLAIIPLAIFLVGVGMITKTQKVAAYNAGEIQGAKYEFVDAAHIKMTTADGSFGFVDSDPGDDDRRYKSPNVPCGGDIVLKGGDVVNPTIANPTSATIEYQQSRSTTTAGGCTEENITVILGPSSHPELVRDYYKWIDKNTIQVIHNGETFVRNEDTPKNYFLSQVYGGFGDPCDYHGIYVANDNRTVLEFELSRDSGPGLKVVNALGSEGSTLVAIINAAFGPGQKAMGCNLQRLNFRTMEQSDPAATKTFSKVRYKIAADSVANATKEPGEDASGGGKGDTSDCVANSNIGLEWLLCPIITSISKATDGINSMVVGQLNFDINQNLSDKPGENGVKTAWISIKNIASAIIVIILLVVIISQATGGGFLDAYTVRKMLPRLVVAVIAMQISWYACRYFIDLANDAGHSIGVILTAPFGGAGNLDLGSLLNRLSGWWAAGTSIATGATLAIVLVSAPVLGAVFLPGILLLIFTLFLSVLVALATLLFRNALIIALVIFSPLALIAWVLPGTQKYWKYWTDNFMKLLLLFPLMITIIWTGRIFAYIAGGLGTPGFLDLLAVLVGFFAPYFIIFKAFKWGGSALSAAHNAVANSGAIRKTREMGNKGLGDWQKRKIGARAEALDPSKPGYAQYGRRIQRGPLKGLPLGFTKESKVGRTALENIAAGRLMPTKRGLAVAIKKGDAFKEEESAIAAAQVKREKDKAMSNGEVGYSLDENGRVKKDIKYNTAGGKASLMKNMGSTDMRVAGVAIEEAIKSSSWVEIAGTLVPIASKDLVNEGAEIHTDADGNMYAKAYELKRWNSKLNSTGELFGATAGKFPLAQPFIQTSDQSEPGKSQAAKMAKFTQDYTAEEAALARQEGRAPREVRPFEPAQKRAVTIMQDYTDAESFKGVSESQWGEVVRLAKDNPAVAYEFQAMLSGFVSSGQAGEEALGHMRSSKSFKAKADALLEMATPLNAHTLTLDDFITAAKARGNAPTTLQGSGPVKTKPGTQIPDRETETPTGEPPETPRPAETPGQAYGRGGAEGASFGPTGSPQEAGAGGSGSGAGGGGVGGGQGLSFEALTEAVERGTRRGMETARPGEVKFTPNVTQIEQPGGVLEIPHQPGETISPGGVILPRGPAAEEQRERQQNPPEEK